MVRHARPAPSVASSPFTLCHLGGGSAAPTDPGGAGGPVLPALPAALSDRAGLGPGPALPGTQGLGGSRLLCAGPEPASGRPGCRAEVGRTPALLGQRPRNPPRDRRVHGPGHRKPGVRDSRARPGCERPQGGHPLLRRAPGPGPRSRSPRPQRPSRAGSACRSPWTFRAGDHGTGGDGLPPPFTAMHRLPDRPALLGVSRAAGPGGTPPATRPGFPSLRPHGGARAREQGTGPRTPASSRGTARRALGIPGDPGPGRGIPRGSRPARIPALEPSVHR